MWNPDRRSGAAGSFTVQCKFSSRETSLHLSDLGDELKKADRLAARGLATNYVLMTNRRVSAHSEAEIRGAFLRLHGLTEFFLLGREWIALKIRESANLRMLVPRVYGLGDLRQILDERAYAQASAILSGLGDDLAKFVVTQPHNRAATALVKCFTMKALGAEDLVSRWNPHEPRQFFWVDDAFGTTQYEQDLSAVWNRAWPHVGAAIRRGARVLLTSRDYIYRAARRDLKLGAFPLISESQVVVEVQKLNREEREQILYNHIKLGQQPRGFRRQIDPFLKVRLDRVTGGEGKPPPAPTYSRLTWSVAT